MTSVTSSDIEKAYLAYLEPGSAAQAATLKFQAGKHKYELNFKGTCQPPSPSRAFPTLTWEECNGHLRAREDKKGFCPPEELPTQGDRPVSG